MSIYLLRHLPTEKNINNVVIGQIDDPILSGYRLTYKDYEPKTKLVIISSPLQRCRQTVALFIGELINNYDILYFEWHISDELIERSFGNAQGKDKTVVRSSFPGYYPDGKLNPRLTFPEGEEFDQFLQRIQRFHDRILSSPNEETDLVVCSHSHVLRVLHCLHFDLNIDANWNKVNYPYGQLTILKNKE